MSETETRQQGPGPYDHPDAAPDDELAELLELAATMEGHDG